MHYDCQHRDSVTLMHRGTLGKNHFDCHLSIDTPPPSKVCDKGGLRRTHQPYNNLLFDRESGFIGAQLAVL